MNSGIHAPQVIMIVLLTIRNVREARKNLKHNVDYTTHFGTFLYDALFTLGVIGLLYWGGFWT